MLRYLLWIFVLLLAAWSFDNPATAGCGKGLGVGLLHRHQSRKAEMTQVKADHARLAIVQRLHQRKADHHQGKVEQMESRRGVTTVIIQQAPPTAKPATPPQAPTVKPKL